MAVKGCCAVVLLVGILFQGSSLSHGLMSHDDARNSIIYYTNWTKFGADPYMTPSGVPADVKLVIPLFRNVDSLYDTFVQNIKTQYKQHELIKKDYGILIEEGTPEYLAQMDSLASDEALSRTIQTLAVLKLSRHLLDLCSYVNLGGKFPIPPFHCLDILKKIQLRSIHSETVECDSSSPYRNYDGTCNNLVHPFWGSSMTPYSRLLPANYQDGLWTLDTTLSYRPQSPSPVAIVNQVTAQGGDIPGKSFTLATVAWMDLVARDLAHTGSHRMLFTGDLISCCSKAGFELAPRYQHQRCLSLNGGHDHCVNYVRSLPAINPQRPLGPAQQMNMATQFLDGSTIYGTSVNTTNALRSFEHGQLKMTQLNDGSMMLPFLPEESAVMNKTVFFTGDLRANLDPLAFFITNILAREHNRLAESLSFLNPFWDDEQLFQEARRFVIAKIQHITYNEWLPLITGYKIMLTHGLFEPFTYDPHISPSVLNSVANAVFHVSASMKPNRFRMLNSLRKLSHELDYWDAAFNLDKVAESELFDSFARSITAQAANKPGLSYSDSVANYSYSMGSKTSFHPLAMAVIRGRDHGLAPYYLYRKALLLPYSSWESLHLHKSDMLKLKRTFTLNNLDLVLGGLAERPVPGAVLGRTFAHLLAIQMARTKKSDRYFYTNTDYPDAFTRDQIQEIEKTTFARLICDNTNIENIQVSAFSLPAEGTNMVTHCANMKEIPIPSLKPWEDL